MESVTSSAAANEAAIAKAAIAVAIFRGFIREGDGRRTYRAAADGTSSERPAPPWRRRIRAGRIRRRSAPYRAGLFRVARCLRLPRPRRWLAMRGDDANARFRRDEG